MRPNTEADFWKKVDRRGPDECWEWLGGYSSRGYGTFVMGKTYSSHRLAHTFANGPIGDGLFVCHRCDNTRCCNPAHLFLGTPKDNSEDMSRKGRASRHAKVGQRKLSDQEVREIRAKYQPRTYSYHRLAAEYGIAAMGVRLIVLRRTYAEVE